MQINILPTHPINHSHMKYPVIQIIKNLFCVRTDEHVLQNVGAVFSSESIRFHAAMIIAKNKYDVKINI